ncbi:MAG: ATPase [Peptococcaceae bacterium BICA1-7]|nr:MAG: ATPase [Peptococcaceae bacterium BICA1-7]HBV97234.1 tRNA 2-thiocytidine biosynthesis protein TtcA [Desulfotomaculum sp.]
MGKKEFRKKALAIVKRAIVDYGMITPGDRVAVGLSGGKDSGVLLYTLEEVRKSAPVKFDLHGIYLDLGFGMDYRPIKEFCASLNVPFSYEVTDIGQIVFDVRNEKNPCALCSTLRRGALNDLALKLGCGRVALGHHLDDVVDTFFLSLFYTGQFRTFSPNTYLDRTGLHMIRPLVYLGQETVRELAVQQKIPVVENPCPASGLTKREEVKKLVSGLSLKYPDLRGKVLSALQGANLDNLWPRTQPRVRRTKDKD